MLDSIKAGIDSPSANKILKLLAQEGYQRLAGNLEVVKLTTGTILYEVGGILDYLYFPYDALISVVTTVAEGATIEVCQISDEGILGITAVLGNVASQYRAIVQQPGYAARIKTSVVQAEFRHSDQLRKLLLRYIQMIFNQVSQSAVCNRFHSLIERLSLCLLRTRDCIHSDQIRLTQEMLAEKLGTRRAGVTEAAGTLQRAGLIRYSRGLITITNGPGLEHITCECYQVSRNNYNQLVSNLAS